MVRWTLSFLVTFGFASIVNGQEQQPTLTFQIRPFSIPIDGGSIQSNAFTVEAIGDKAIRQGVAASMRERRRLAIEHAQAIARMTNPSGGYELPRAYPQTQKLPPGRAFWTNDPDHIAWCAVHGRTDWQNVLPRTGTTFIPTSP
jgi:hypothetical protein